MDSLGACLIANDIPFEGLAKDMFDRRVQGKSWKEISDEFDIGSPSKARKLFTKHTGITDYQIKGDELLKLAKGGLDPKLTAPKLKKLKMIEEKIEDKIAIPGKLMKDGEEKVIQLWKDGVGQYTKLAQESGLSMGEIDQIVWRESLKATEGDVWKAHKIKQTSEEGIKAVRKQVFEMRSNGYSVAQIVDHSGIPKDVVEKILGGKWKPSPFTDTGIGVPHPKFHKTIGKADRPPTPFGSDEFPLLTEGEMNDLFGGYDAVKNKGAVGNYTGSGYSEINRGLRTGNVSDKVALKIKKLDNAMTVVQQPMTVTRGMGLDGFGMGHIGTGTEASIREALVGTIFEDQGFFSTSIAPNGVFHRTGGVRLEIEVPPGAQGIWAQPVSNHKSELEFILARNTKMMVTSVERSTSAIETWLVKARVIVGA